MLKLIYKDFLCFRYIIFSQLLFIIILITFGIMVDQNGSMIFLALIMYPLILPTILLSYDQKYSILFASLPVKRKTYVYSKYIGGLLFSFVLVSLGMVYGYICTNLIATEVSGFLQLFSLKSFIFVTIPIIIVNSTTFPIYFKFSRDKGNLVLMLVFATGLIGLIIGLVIVENSLTIDSVYSKQDVFPVLIYYVSDFIKSIGRTLFRVYIAVGTVLILGFSILLSRWIFSRKDIGDL